jgi:hypothetical protein
MLPTFLESLHRFHTYCARFPSEIVEAALAKYTKPGDSVLDPNCLRVSASISDATPLQPNSRPHTVDEKISTSHYSPFN